MCVVELKEFHSVDTTNNEWDFDPIQQDRSRNVDVWDINQEDFWDETPANVEIPTLPERNAEHKLLNVRETAGDVSLTF